MRLIPLASGSRGNATLVELGETRLLLDAGVSARQLTNRLQAVDVDPRSVRCMLVSHEHQDHARGAERFSKLHGVPLACTARTLDALDVSPVHVAEWWALPEDGCVEIGSIRVESFPVPHDAAQPVGFVLHGEGLRVGYALDLGHTTTLVRERLRGCEVLMVESNHDEALLRDGPYPWHLKQRVGGRMGHLSNDETAELLGQIVGPDCRAVVLAHLSEKNNTHALARRSAGRALQEAGGRRTEMRIAAARSVTPPVLI
jgi:phosphoribosyl 1,2-cyclic phosphodiesterase